MRTINRLLIADLKQMWGQALAICVVLACGVATYTMSFSTIESLDVTCSRYYRDYRFADLFASLERAPNVLARRIAEIPGVEQVDTRVVRDVILDIPGMIEPASCRIVSLPDRPNASLNAVYLRRGRLPNPDRRGEVLASELFAEANDLLPGDTVRVIMGGRQETLRIVGIGLSPEYIFAVKPAQMLPDDRHFGILWMPYRQMASAFNMEGAFNDVSLRLSARASVPDVIDRLDRLTQPYGGLGAYSREDQTSHRRVSDEISQLRGMSRISPTIFLAVAAFLFNLVFSRIVYRRQEEIATLRAFGYRPFDIGAHFLKMLLVLVGLGFLLGSLVGVYLSQWMVSLYSLYFRFPVLYRLIDWTGILVAGGLSLGVGLAGGLAAVREAMRLPPAVAMRPQAPATFRRSLLERLGLSFLLSTLAMLVLRRIERNRNATLLSILGMALGVALLVLGSFMEDTINYIIDVEFERSQRQDVMITFYQTLSPGTLHDVRHLPGVLSAEGFRAAPVRLTHDKHSRRVSLMGLEESPRLFRVLDKHLHEVRFRPGGLTISEKMAELLDVKIGEEVEVAFLEGRRFRRRVPVVAIFADYTEPGAYINRYDLHRVLREGDCLSGAFLQVDLSHLNELNRQLKETPAAVGVTLKTSALESFATAMDENLGPMRVMNAVFASIIAFGVIYNCALNILAERSRDLATLRVLGFSNREVSVVLLGELGVITLAALPLGLPLGYLLAWVATLALDTETHRIPLVVTEATFGYAALVMLTAATVSALIVRRMIDRLDLIAVLKVKE